MNASDVTATRQRNATRLPLASTLLTTTQIIRSTIDGSTTSVTRTTSTLQIAPRGFSFSYETLAKAPVNPALAPFVTQRTVINAYESIYHCMNTPSTILKESTRIALAPTAPSVHE